MTEISVLPEPEARRLSAPRYPEAEELTPPSNVVVDIVLHREDLDILHIGLVDQPMYISAYYPFYIKYLALSLSLLNRRKSSLKLTSYFQMFEGFDSCQKKFLIT